MPTTFDYLFVNDVITSMINNNIYEPMIIATEGGYRPSLAKTWFVESDTIFVVTLVENLRFSDGTAVEDSDIIYSLSRLSESTNPMFRTLISMINIRSFDIENSNTIRIKHQGSSNLIVTYLTRVVLYKKEHMENNDAQFLQNNPMSTGEYYLYSVSDERVILKKNPFHRDFKQNRYSPEVVELMLVPSLTDQFQMLLNDEVDFVMNVPHNRFNELLYDKRFTTFSRESCSYIYMMFDTVSDVVKDVNLSRNPFKDRRVRRAMAHAVDIRSFIETELNGLANSLAIPAMRHLYGYPEHLDFYEYDISQSKQLLSEAGLSDGFDMSIVVFSRPINNSVAEFIKASLSDVNINVSLVYKETTDFINSLQNDSPPVYILSSTWSRAITAICSTLFTHFLFEKNNDFPHINELILLIESMNELHTQLPMLYKQLAEYIYEEAAILPLIQPLDLSAISNDFKFNASFEYNFPTMLLFTDFKKNR
jgi:peptide/nickel transport system substrate-binding protein